MLSWTPRLLLHSVITGPTYSWGMNSVTLTMGSRISAILAISGMRDGLSMVTTVPSRCSTS
ncbi:Uncharacterised protein [Bordetella pertussis]|nr:Uncharacterised protein [Bordetella pertussis]CFO68461.1 Uncharacterised protein [Bordetella pertussis]CFU81058.1 Uncharacterised protein [Bordetella pertussis]CFW05663.1 Uncharacterised protein [Bordetella pertussis]CFW29782.1 Uncharacterised protein [Bordetella pertussis]